MLTPILRLFSLNKTATIESSFMQPFLVKYLYQNLRQTFWETIVANFKDNKTLTYFYNYDKLSKMTSDSDDMEIKNLTVSLIF